MITRAKRELIAGGFIFETVKGQRPNRASWYAVTWRALDKLPGYDAGAAETFQRGAYAAEVRPKAQHTRQEIYEKWRKPVEKNAGLIPSHGAEGPPIAPSHGAEGMPPTPSHGAIRPTFHRSSTPSRGNHLDMPSAVAVPATTH